MSALAFSGRGDVRQVELECLSGGTRPESPRTFKARNSPMSTTTASPGSRLQIKVTMQPSQVDVCRWEQVEQSIVSVSVAGVPGLTMLHDLSMYPS